MTRKATISELHDGAFLTLGDAARLQASPEQQLAVAPSYAQLHVSTAVETSIGTQGEFVKVAGTSTLSSPAVGWSSPADGRLRYDGDGTRLVQVHAALSLEAAGPAIDVAWRLAKNGVTIADTEIIRRITLATEAGAAPLVGLAEVATGDYLEVWVANLTNTTNVTADRLVLTAVSW